MLSFRKAQPEDAASISDLHVRTVRTIKGPYSPEEIEAWAVPRTLESYRQAIETMEFWLAFEGDALIGFGVLDQNRSEVQALYASPEVKGTGVGFRLLQKLEERARALGISTLSLDASLNAVDFYRKAGYVPHAESRHRLSTGAEIRCVPMTKTLSP